jgi:hypothetical protein
VLRAIDAAVSAEGAGPKDVADAAMGLAYLQARGDRRCGAARRRVGVWVPAWCPGAGAAAAEAPRQRS